MRELWIDPKTYDPKSVDTSLRQDIEYQKGIYFLSEIFWYLIELVDYSWRKDALNRVLRESEILTSELNTAAWDILSLPQFDHIVPYLSDIPSTLSHDNDFYANKVSDFIIFNGIIKAEHILCGENKFKIPRYITNTFKRIRTVAGSVNIEFEELLSFDKTHLQLRERNGRITPKVSITKREYKLLKILHERKGKRVEYAIIGGTIEGIKRVNAEKIDPKNRIIQIYKGLIKKMDGTGKSVIIKDYYGLKLICKTKKI